MIPPRPLVPVSNQRRSLRGSQSSRPGKRPVTNPAWPPCAGCSSTTAGETSAAEASDEAGMNGSFRALSTSVGTAILASHGFDEARDQ